MASDPLACVGDRARDRQLHDIVDDVDARAFHPCRQGRNERLVGIDPFLQVVQRGLRPAHLPDRHRGIRPDEFGEGGLVWRWIVRHEDRDDAAARLVDVDAARDVGVLGEVVLQGGGERLLAVRTTHDLVTLERHQGHAEIHHGGRVRGDGADPDLILTQAELPAQGDRLGDLLRAEECGCAHRRVDRLGRRCRPGRRGRPRGSRRRLLGAGRHERGHEEKTQDRTRRRHGKETNEPGGVRCRSVSSSRARSPVRS